MFVFRTIMELEADKRQEFINICGKYTQIGGAGVIVLTFCDRKDDSKDFSGNLTVQYVKA